MIRLTSQINYTADDGAVVNVQTSRTFYRVVLSDTEVRVFGPGVDEIYTLGDEIPDDLSPEGTAAVAVLHFEESKE